MKNTILWGALFTVLCSQAQAEATTTAPAAAEPATQKTQATTPAQAQPTTQPVQATPAAAPVINCDYKIDMSTKIIEPTLVQTWSEKATTQAFDFDPTTIDAQMQKLQNCFTEQGWTGFNTALQKSGNLDSIKSQHLTVSSQIDGTSTVDEVRDNQWKLTLPLQVVYQNDKEKVTQLLNIKLTVSRKPTGDLGITQMVATPRGTEAAPAATTPAATTGTPATTPASIPATDTTTTPATEATPAATTPEVKH